MTHPMLAPTIWIGAADCPLRGAYAGTGATAASTAAPSRAESERGVTTRHSLNPRPAATVPGAARSPRLTRAAADGREA